MFNMLAINPAYAGSREALSAVAIYRNQWMGFEGAPVSQTFAVHTMLKNEKVGLGLTINNDKISIQSNTNLQLCYSYILNVANGKLAFGLQGGIINYKEDFSKIKFTDQEDYDFKNQSFLLPSFGAGLYYHTDRMYVGVSSPRITAFQANNRPYETTMTPHYFVTAGYKIDVGENFILSPSTLLKKTASSPIQLDINTILTFKNTVGVGCSYRLNEAIVALLQVHIKKIKLGYAFDYGLGAISKIGKGSHEVFISFETSIIKDKIVSPRFF